MSDQYALDLYPRSDPRDGAALVRYTYEDLIAAEVRDVIGVGSGQATIWHDHAGAEFIDSLGEQYVRVVRLGAPSEVVVTGFWTSKLPFETAVASERRHLTFSGPGQMAYLARAVMAPHSYLNEQLGAFIPQDPFDDRWRLSEQSTIFAGGSFLGAMLWRVIAEAQNFRSGATYTHKHADGETYTDSHADDRLATRIGDLVLGFDQFEDSNGNAWTLTAGEFSAQVGENVLGVVQRLMQSGLSVWMDPDTFTLYAWEGRPATKLGRSTNRTGGAWGTDVVRFQSPTDGTLATGNILSDANRIVNSYLPRGPIWVGGNDIYHKETGAADAMYEGFVHSTAEDTTALAAIGDAQSTAREEASDVGSLRTRLGNLPLEGAYRPGEHYRLDELVRVHTGTGEFDYDEDDYPVGAWRISLPAGGAEWEAYAELGASYEEAQRREFAIPSTPGHTHPSNLCRPSSPGEVVTARLYYTNGNDGSSGLDETDYDAAWDVASTGGPLRLRTTPQDTLHNSGGHLGGWNAINAAAGQVVTNLWTFPLSDSATVLAAIQDGGTFRTVLRCGNRHGVGVSESTQANFPAGVGRVFRPGTGFIGTLFGFGDLVSAVRFDITGTNPSVPMETAITPVPSAVGTDYFVLDLGGDHVGPTSGATGFGYRPADSSDTDLPFEFDSVADQNAWAEFASVGSVGGTTGDGHIRLVGTSNRAKRCDDTEHWHDSREPTVLDDSDQGMRIGTLWLDDTTGRVWWLTDNTVGAAVWVLISDPTLGSGGGGGGTTLTVTEEDESPSVVADTIIFPNGSVTDNADGSVSIAFEETPHAHDPPTAGTHKVLVQRTTSFTTGPTNDSMPDYDTVIEDTMTDPWWDAGAPDRFVVTADYDGLDAIITAKGAWADPGSSDYVECKMYLFPAAYGEPRPMADTAPEEEYLLGVEQHPAADNVNHFIEFVSDPVTIHTGDVILVAWRNENAQTLIPYFGRVSITLGAYIVGSGGGSVSEDDVMNAGRWEVVVSGTAPPVAVTNEAEDDWLYAWVSGP